MIYGIVIVIVCAIIILADYADSRRQTGIQQLIDKRKKVAGDSESF